MEKRLEVERFADEMEFYLRKNDYKGKYGWREFDFKYLYRRLIDNAISLSERLDDEQHGAAIKCAADVANYAMMIADKLVLQDGICDKPESNRVADGSGLIERITNRVYKKYKHLDQSICEPSDCGTLVSLKFQKQMIFDLWTVVKNNAKLDSDNNVDSDNVDLHVAKSHELKISPKYYDDILIGKKKFEVRKNDRGFKVGDTLLLREWSDGYTGREMSVEVTYILFASEFVGLLPGFVAMGISAKRDEMGKVIRASNMNEMVSGVEDAHKGASNSKLHSGDGK